MDKVFLQVINMSITATYAILLVIIFRLFLKKVPKMFLYVLWSIVFLRLILPFSFQSAFSLMPRSTLAVLESTIYEQASKLNNDITITDNGMIVFNSSEEEPINKNNGIAKENTNENLSSITTFNRMILIQIGVVVGSTIWLIGVGVLLIYSIASSLKISKRLKSSKALYDNIYETDNIKTPFVFGILNAKIYLPTNLSESEKPYIIQHELTHIKRCDNVIKFLAFLIVSIHWFNPFVWLAFILMTKDMEFSCDEFVIKKMGNEIKKSYSNSLLSLSAGRKIIGGSPLAFGENNIKERIKNILNYKKPGFWIIIICVAVLIMAMLGLLSDPKETYKSNQAVINFTLSNGEACKMLLSQPVTQGGRGIWAVERLMDGIGTIYYEYPDTNMKTEDYYKSLQKKFDNGDSPYLGDIVELGYKYIIENLNLKDVTIKKNDLVVKYPASIEDFLETPINHYIGYILKMSLDIKRVNIDYVEWLTQNDTERLEELNIDSNSLGSGFYIYNPNINTYSFQLSDETEYYILNWNELKGDFDLPKLVTKEELIEYIDGLSYTPLFNIFTKDGYVIKIEERYVP
jgi:beta-lactamase regulating signal transducer with metallopeptidase domain